MIETMNKSKISKKLNNLPLEERESLLKIEMIKVERLKRVEALKEASQSMEELSKSLSIFSYKSEIEKLKRQLDCEKLKNDALQEKFEEISGMPVKEYYQTINNAVSISNKLKLEILEKDNEIAKLKLDAKRIKAKNDVVFKLLEEERKPVG